MAEPYLRDGGSWPNLKRLGWQEKLICIEKWRKKRFCDKKKKAAEKR